MTAPVGATPPGRIGPNAIIRVAEALLQRHGRVATAALFERAELLHYLRVPPTGMVDEREVQRLHGAVRAQLNGTAAQRVAVDAGCATADYLLAHRIPRPFQHLLAWLPASWAARLLVAAIARHAWTFVGSGRFEVRPGRPLRLIIRSNPLCRGLAQEVPACDYHAATFERLFRALVHPRSTVHEMACEARGDAECRFEVRW